MLLMTHIDYLVGTLEYNDGAQLSHLLRGVSQYTGAKLEIDPGKPVYRGQYWQASGQSANMTMAAAQYPLDGLPGKLWVSIPGKPLSAMPWRDQQAMIAWLAEEGFRATRIDIAMDVPRSECNRTEIRQAIEKNEYQGFRSHQLIESRKGRKNAWCYYLGQPTGLSRMCIYDKYLESEGVIDAIRFEYRVLDERARAIMGYIVQNGMATEAGWCTALAGVWSAATDFRDSSTDRRKARQQRLIWWENIIEAAGKGVSPQVEKKSASVINRLEWLKKQVMGTMQMLRLAAGPEQMGKLAMLMKREAPIKMTKARQAMIDYWRMEMRHYGLITDYGACRGGVCGA